MTSTTLVRRRLTSPDAATTRAIGASLGRVARAGDLICLRGDLGAGKTQLAKGIAAGLGVTTTVNSPSFVLMAEHLGRLPFFHLDLYRLADAADVLAGGLLDERRADGVTVVEWAERLGTTVPAGRLEIAIDGSGDDPRVLELTATSADFVRFLEAVP
ncbi:MAG TPA: tRNA (adenosine(37)-N6)-threonylcarbamoyltransferase complex ATPase subunit type 1 TsaE [Candidatus Limnocylindrales bacterium]|nr:tRNA (adenosine(37)-N6)-threonylcarbamoyltransferase complex ATPase subunit type 1 TsaE [Candidatus Limnocylindrales bacterium]